MADEYLKSLLMKMITRLKSDTNKPMSSMFYLERHISSKGKSQQKNKQNQQHRRKFSKEIEIFFGIKFK